MFLALLCFNIFLGTDAQTYTLSITGVAPTNASKVDGSFPAFAFEQASFVPYSTNLDGSANSFTANLINAISSRTGSQPIIRVGGTSGDHATLDFRQQGPTNPSISRTQRPAFNDLKIGPTFFNSFRNLPGAQYVVNVPLGNRDVKNAMEFSKQYWRAVGKQNLQAIELGNEPDLYNPAPQRQDYVTLVNRYEDLIVGNVTGLPSGPIFQVPDGARLDGYPADQMIPLGLNAKGKLKSCSYHYYQAIVPPSGQFDLKQIMNHSAIARHLDDFRPQVEFLAKNTSGKVPLVLSEVGNTLLSTSNMPDPGYTFRNNLGSALWAVDFQLYAMAMGIGRVHLQQILSAGYSLWLPIASEGEQPQVRPNFYSQPFIADFIGKSRQTQVARFHVSGGTGYSGLSGYAAYDAGKLARVAIVNFNFWSNSTPSGPSPDSTPNRPVQTMHLNISQAIKSATIQTLTAPDGAYANTSLTWRGLQWLSPDGREALVGNSSRSLTVTNNSVDVPVKASEAVMVIFE